jgi:RNA polymerase sigma-70 factor (sigma-E family)
MQAALEQEYVEFVTARIPALRRLAFSLCGDAHRGDDLVQQTITRLYLSWRRARAATSLDGYARTTLVRTYLDERRLAWARRVTLAPVVPDQAAPDGADLDDRVLLRAALGKVPPRQRAVLVLRFVHDLPVEEVAEILRCSAGTVKSQTSHGLAALRRALGPQALLALEKETR